MSAHKKPLTIALTGTHGAGKTTLTNALSSVLHLEPINISRPTAAAQQLGYAKAADVPADEVQVFQWMGLFEQIHQERLRLERPDQTVNKTGQLDFRYVPGFVSDRAVIDFIAYYIYRLPSVERQAAYTELVLAYARKYSIILYLPPNPDGVEDDNRRFVKGTLEIDENIRFFLTLWKDKLPPVINVPWMSVDSRVSFVCEQLQLRELLPY